ncbi:MAG: hypothetical protein ABIE22_03020 [archaeon]
MQQKEEIQKQPASIRRVTASNKFIIALALVSMVGFGGIISETLFSFDANLYVEALLMLIIGVGLILESQLSQLKNLKLEGLTSKNFTRLTTLSIGVVAVLAGIFSLPQIRYEHPTFLAVKGIISVIAIIVIIIQTWIVE